MAISRTNLHSSSTFRVNLPSSYQAMHHIRHLDSIASSIPSISTWWNRLQEESSILVYSEKIGEGFAKIKYARMYDQSRVDAFIADMKIYAGYLRDVRVGLEAQHRKRSTRLLSQDSCS